MTVLQQFLRDASAARMVQLFPDGPLVRRSPLLSTRSPGLAVPLVLTREA